MKYKVKCTWLPGKTCDVCGKPAGFVVHGSFRQAEDNLLMSGTSEQWRDVLLCDACAIRLERHGYCVVCDVSGILAFATEGNLCDVCASQA